MSALSAAIGQLLYANQRLQEFGARSEQVDEVVARLKTVRLLVCVKCHRINECPAKEVFTYLDGMTTSHCRAEGCLACLGYTHENCGFLKLAEYV